MIIKMNPMAKIEEIEKIKKIIQGKGLEIHLSKGNMYDIIGVIGDTPIIDPKKMEVLKGVDNVIKVQEPFKKANRMFKPKDTVIDINSSIIGEHHLDIIAGPC